MHRPLQFRVALFAVTCAAAAVSGDTYSAAERRHWAFQPRAHAAVPSFSAAADRQWVKNPIDAFVLARLEKDGLRPAPAADRATLIRRVSFDLTGMPPAPEEVERFTRDSSPDAWPRLVDRLLESPGYGEHWARHWLDVVRFAESDGFEYDTHRSEAWRYRDYVIRSIQHDKPYDQFLREQLAGDEIDPKNEEMLVAAGFHRLGAFRKNAGNQDAAYNRNEILVEMTNVIGSAMLGVTLGCARCHDHKFDPIRQKDYYRMQAFFAATQQRDIPKSTAEEQAEWKKKSDPIEAELKKLRAKLKPNAPDRYEIETQIAYKEKQLPPPLPVLQTVQEDPAKVIPVHVLARGDSAQAGEAVAMRPLGVLLPDGAPDWSGRGEPRLALANWIADPANPLTARVMANRIWQGHFGSGIVATPNDFGRMGSRPAHPELLDWLANQFVEGGFHLKPVHRLILLSSTYQQSGTGLQALAAKAAEADPDDHLLWRFPRRRLESEEIRDAMLAVSGRLNPERGGPSVIVPIEPELLKLIYNPTQWRVNPDAKEFDRRSIYLFQKRNMRLPFMEVFDAPDTLLSCARREQSTHAPQALELLNGEFSNGMARAFAERIAREAGPDHEKQIARAFRLALGRAPNAAERTAALAYLKRGPLSEFALALFLVNDFLYVN